MIRRDGAREAKFASQQSTCVTEFKKSRLVNPPILNLGSGSQEIERGIKGSVYSSGSTGEGSLY